MVFGEGLPNRPPILESNKVTMADPLDDELDSCFSHVTKEELVKIIFQSSNTFCDSIPTSLLKQCLSALVPTLTTMISMSLSTGVIPNHYSTIVLWAV